MGPNAIFLKPPIPIPYPRPTYLRGLNDPSPGRPSASPPHPPALNVSVKPHTSTRGQFARLKRYIRYKKSSASSSRKLSNPVHTARAIPRPKVRHYRATPKSLAKRQAAMKEQVRMGICTIARPFLFARAPSTLPHPERELSSPVDGGWCRKSVALDYAWA